MQIFHSFELCLNEHFYKMSYKNLDIPFTNTLSLQLKKSYYLMQ